MMIERVRRKHEWDFQDYRQPWTKPTIKLIQKIGSGGKNQPVFRRLNLMTGSSANETYQMLARIPNSGDTSYRCQLYAQKQGKQLRYWHVIREIPDAGPRRVDPCALRQR
jgi:hypothetical protein